MATNNTNSADRQQQPNGQQPAAAPPSSSSSPVSPADQALPTASAQRAGLAQALAELARGERAADKLERELHAFEAKLEELLSSMGMTEADLDAMEDDGSDEKDEGDEGGAAGMDSNATISKTDGTSSA